MGQKCNPIGNRLGIIRGWDSMWYGEKRDFGQKLVEDHKIRNYLNARINKGGISRIVIERTLGKLIIPSTPLSLVSSSVKAVEK